MIPFSKMKMAVLAALKREGYISDFVDNKEDASIEIKIVGCKKSMKKIRRVSKPGRRMYAKSTNIPRPKNGYGVVILSTPEGVMSGREAVKAGVGGEIICEVF
jgi:small subunit ribosomal protein S8